MISTCQIVLSTCHLFTFLKIQHENVSTTIRAIQLTTVYMTSRHRVQTCRHNHFTCRHNFLLRRQVNIILWRNWLHNLNDYFIQTSGHFLILCLYHAYFIATLTICSFVLDCIRKKPKTKPKWPKFPLTYIGYFLTSRLKDRTSRHNHLTTDSRTMTTYVLF